MVGPGSADGDFVADVRERLHHLRGQPEVGEGRLGGLGGVGAVGLGKVTHPATVVVLTLGGCFEDGAIPVTCRKPGDTGSATDPQSGHDCCRARPAQGLTTRPLTKADSRILFELIAAQEREDTGEVDIEEADLISDWAKPSHDLAASSVAVFDGDQLVAYAELVGRRSRRRRRAPHLSRAAGSAPGWPPGCARSGARAGSTVVGMPVPEGSAGDRLLAALGYRVRWTSWILQLPEGTQIPSRELPPGDAVREALEADLRAAHDVLEDAFLEWSVRERESYEDFAAATFGRPGYAPWNFRVAVDADGEVVGVSLVFISTESSTAYISRLAVRTRPAQPRHRPGAARRLLRRGPRARGDGLRAQHRLAHGGARALREGRHGDDRRVGQPLHRPLSRPAERRSVGGAGRAGERGRPARPGCRSPRWRRRTPRRPRRCGRGDGAGRHGWRARRGTSTARAGRRPRARPRDRPARPARRRG